MKTNLNKTLTSVIVISILALGGYFLVMNNEEAKKETVKNTTEQSKKSKQTEQKKQSSQATKMIVFRTPNCGCCMGYADEMKNQGFDVEVIALNDINTIKAKYNIPADKQSCHTTVVGDYFIEGHVPVAAVKKLLKEKPDIDGIGLPGMPIGTPGMPGEKTEPYKVYQSKNGKFSEFITL